ncbi:54S ribosomal protein L7, mitochondrial [Cryptotrichosporon argae]
MSLRTAASASRSVRNALTPRLVRTAASSSSIASSSSTLEAPEWTMPEIHLGPTHPSRYGDHYHRTLSSDLLYMTYNHRVSALTPPAPVAAPQTAYELNRPAPAPRGNRPVRPLTHPVTPASVPRLESIVVHTFIKEAITSKHALLSAIMALRAISGEAPAGAGRAGSKGVEVVVSRTGAAAFKLRAGMPVAAKVELRGAAMYDFIQSLVDFVLPRIREFPGIALPPASASKNSPSALGGVVSFGMPATAMALFPQIEANLDAYPKLHGFHMHFKTNARGKDAQEHARALLSGFRIPFHRK